MDERSRESQNRPMGRIRSNPFSGSSTLRHYIVIWDLEWQVIDCRSLPRGGGLCAALAEALERLGLEGWQAEGNCEFGFAFVARGGERRLVMITGRDPFNATTQSFSPFGASSP
jgi:hypothetical protein